MRRLIDMSLALGLLAILAIGAANMALIDIAHGEGDLSLEWAIVRVAALLILMFIALALATLWRLRGRVH